MTADFLTDLDVIGHLDWVPGCDRKGCEATAVWLVAIHMTCCEKKKENLACDPCLKSWLRAVERAKSGIALCIYCGDLSIGSDALVIDRIAPLNA